MNTQKPVVIDIEVRKMSPGRSPPIAQKLMKQKAHTEAAPSIEDIEQKLKKAEELRKEEFARKKPLTDEKLHKVLERKSTQEKEQLEKLQKEIDQKAELADELRKKAILTRVTVAKKHSAKVEQAQHKAEEMEKDKENKIRLEMEKKDELAMKICKEATEEVIKKAKAELEKVQKVVETHKCKKTLEIENKKQELLIKHQKADENRGKILEQVKQTA